MVIVLKRWYCITADRIDFFPLSVHQLSKQAFHPATYIPSIKAILFANDHSLDLFDIPTLTMISNETTLEIRKEQRATLLLDGRALIRVDIKDDGFVSCQIFDQSIDRFISAANMSPGRY